MCWRVPGESSPRMPAYTLPGPSKAMDVTGTPNTFVQLPPESEDTNKPSCDPASSRDEFVESIASAHTGRFVMRATLVHVRPPSEERATPCDARGLWSSPVPA